MPTLLAQLQRVLAKAADTNTDALTPPACVLWPDGDGHFERVLPRLRAAMPHLYVLGDYDPAQRQGPAAWLRCVVAGTVATTSDAQETTPILYLPGVTRHTLRSAEECEPPLKPLVELQYRGTYCSQESHRDWTPMALLTNAKEGLGLTVSRDAATKQELSRCLPQLLEFELDELQGRTIDETSLRHLLLEEDPIRQVLRYLNAGDAYREQLSPDEWGALAAELKRTYALDVAKMGHLGALTEFGDRTGKWRVVFERYAEAPGRYADIANHLRRVQLATDMFWLGETGNHDGWPQWNAGNEVQLREALQAIPGTPPHERVAAMRELEDHHGMRRDLVWAQLGEAPLAQSLQHLYALAQACARALPGESIEVLAKAYETEGYLTDDLVLQSLHCVHTTEDRTAVTAVVRALYEPWVEACAKTLQTLVAQGEDYPGPSLEHLAATPLDYAAGTCILFVDGLRYDTGVRLYERLERQGVNLGDREAVWSALPSVTATAKPAVSPVAHFVDAGEASEVFEPRIRATGKPLNSSAFTRLLDREGWQSLSKADAGDPTGRAWSSIKQLDKEGHEGQPNFAERVDGILDDVARRVQGLLQAGWRHVRIVTDHGWLYLPDGLPKEKLDTVLAVSRWGRSALLKEGSTADDLQQVPWTWNPLVHFVLPHGINCFKAGQHYSHGGLSPQECLTLHFSAHGKQNPSAIAITASWIRQKCSVATEGPVEGLRVDLRRSPNEATSSVVLSPKHVNDEGMASVTASELELDEREVPLYVVLIDEKGDLRAQLKTTSPA